MDVKRVLSAEDFFELKSVTNPQFSPDGKHCVYVQTEILKEEKEYVSNLYMLDLESVSEPRQWTFGQFRSHSPRWSPDGKKLAFVSNRSGKNQIFVMDARGGEARKLTSCLHGAEKPVWSPDGNSIAFQVTLKTRGFPHG